MKWQRTTQSLAIPVLIAGCGGDSPTAPDPPVATTVTLSASALTFSSLGETQQLVATVRDQNGASMSGAAVAWSSSDPLIASVSGGLVTAVANGAATITATSGAASGRTPVTVADPDPDDDGILGIADLCPTQPETFNGVFDTDGCPDTPAEFYSFVRTDVETYWDSVFVARQWAYAPISQFTGYFGETTTPCGVIPASGAWYCAGGVYYHIPFMDELLADIGDAAPAFVIGHELGHHIGIGHLGWVPGVNLTTKESELGADCFGGAWLAWVDARGMLESGDAEELAETMLTLGDPADTWFDPTAHGTPEQRAAALVVGLTSGPWACLPDPGSVAGWVFNDANGNGLWDTGEGIWQNVPVGITDQWGRSSTVFTDANGRWVASDLPVGFAVVDIDEAAFPAGVTRTFGTDPDTVIVVTGVVNEAGFDGFYQPPPALGVPGVPPSSWTESPVTHDASRPQSAPSGN